MRRIIVSLGIVATLGLMPAAEARYEPSKTISRGGGELVYKMDGKRIIKLAVRTPTDNGEWAVEWWKTGKRFALFVPAGTTIDLWKSELKPFGNAVKDVNSIDFDMLGDSRWYGSAKVWGVQPDGSIKLIHKPRPAPADCNSPASCGG